MVRTSFRKSVHPLLTRQYLNFSCFDVYVHSFSTCIHRQQDAFSTVFARVMDAQQKGEARLSRRRERERRNRASESAEQRQARLFHLLREVSGLNVKPVFPDSDDTECVRCRQDKHIPKTYSSGNNMDPGPVPSELQVHIQSTYIYMYTCMLMCRYAHVCKLLNIPCIYTIYV